MTSTLPPEWNNREPDYFSTSVFWPVRNGWQVASRRRFTAVYGGGDGVSQHTTTGRLAIFRQNYVRGTQDIDFADVPEAGPLTIIGAPIGNKKGLNRIQREATLEFTSKRGLHGEFHLSDDSVTLLP